MDWLICALIGLVIGAGGMLAVQRRQARTRNATQPSQLADVLATYFGPNASLELTITERIFPCRMRADLQRALEAFFSSQQVWYFAGLSREYAHENLKLAQCFMHTEHNRVLVSAPSYEDVDIGDESPMRCLSSGAWFFENNGMRCVVVLSPAGRYGQMTGSQLQFAVRNCPEGTQFTAKFFDQLETAVRTSGTYRGRILSLEMEEHSYSGQSSGIQVHQLQAVTREQVILPAQTVELLERNVVNFVQQRPALAKLGMPTRKGLLFYGPPGTGKTHTLHFLIGALKGHTTLLVTAEQMGMLKEYMTLARLLQPSIVIIEDVDLIAREREQHNNACSESLLNQLLNEMDGLRPNADILFLLTTNRPDALEPALASRPGRVDQAIEFPVPDDTGRQKLIRLYSAGMKIPDELMPDLVRRTEGVSAAFLKEFMRRTAQFHLERSGTGVIEHQDLDAALDEMLVMGGRLNQSLLGAGASISGRAELGD